MTVTGWVTARGRIALALVLLYAAASAARMLYEVRRRPVPAAGDEISANDRRFERLRAELPAGGEVGYLGDPELTGAIPRDSVAAALLHFRRYLLAQYALAPVVLVENTTPDLLVGNFDPGRRPEPSGFRLVRDFGGGLLLYRRAAP